MIEVIVSHPAFRVAVVSALYLPDALVALIRAAVRVVEGA